jgi:hypothetical protein
MSGPNVGGRTHRIPKSTEVTNPAIALGTGRAPAIRSFALEGTHDASNAVTERRPATGYAGGAR